MTDLLLDADFDLKITNGDFAIGDSKDQNLKLVFEANPGDFKEYLDCGIAFGRSKNGNIDRFLDRTIRTQLKADGFKISKLEIKETGVSIDGSYEGV